MLVPRRDPNTRDSAATGAGRRCGDDSSDSDSFLRKEAQLTLSQMLFDGFETRSEVERQTARVSSAAYRVQETAEFTALDGVEAHLEVLRYQEIVKLSDANLAQLERYLTQVRDLERGGRADSSDVEQTWRASPRPRPASPAHAARSPMQSRPTSRSWASGRPTSSSRRRRSPRWPEAPRMRRF